VGTNSSANLPLKSSYLLIRSTRLSTIRWYAKTPYEMSPAMWPTLPPRTRTVRAVGVSAGNRTQAAIPVYSRLFTNA